MYSIHSIFFIFTHKRPSASATGRPRLTSVSFRHLPRGTLPTKRDPKTGGPIPSSLRDYCQSSGFRLRKVSLYHVVTRTLHVFSPPLDCSRSTYLKEAGSSPDSWTTTVFHETYSGLRTSPSSTNVHHRLTVRDFQSNLVI